MARTAVSKDAASLLLGRSSPHHTADLGTRRLEFSLKIDHIWTTGKKSASKLVVFPRLPSFSKFRNLFREFQKLGSLRANPARRRAAAILEGAGPSFKENWNGRNRLGLG